MKSARSIGQLAIASLSIVAVVAVLSASGSENKATKVGDTKSSGSKTTPAATIFKVGDVVKLGSWSVKVWAVKDPQPAVNEFSKPSAGNRWVAADVEVTNLSKKADSVSSLMCFKAHDSLNHDYSVDLGNGITPDAPDGDVEAGGAKRGMLVFEVPTTAKGLQLRFSCDLLSNGSAIIALS